MLVSGSVVPWKCCLNISTKNVFSKDPDSQGKSTKPVWEWELFSLRFSSKLENRWENYWCTNQNLTQTIYPVNDLCIKAYFPSKSPLNWSKSVVHFSKLPPDYLHWQSLHTRGTSKCISFWKSNTTSCGIWMWDTHLNQRWTSNCMISSTITDQKIRSDSCTLKYTLWIVASKHGGRVPKFEII